MCSKIAARQLKTPLSAAMVKFVVVLAIFLYAECAAGSCLNYGHACWGAHGKRSDRQEPLSRLDNEASSNKDDAKVEWFLSKMISPLDLRYYRRANLLDASRNQPEIDELFTDTEGANIKSGSEWERLREAMGANRLAAGSIDSGRSMENYLKSPKILEKRSTNDE